MAIAKGAKSKLLWKEETTYNTKPGGVYALQPFSSESMVENISKVVSDEIKSNRQIPAIRGGNIMAGGGVQTDWVPERYVRWLVHLLAGTVVKATVGKAALTPDVTIATLASGAITRGTYVLSGARVYLCIQGGTISAGEATTGLTSTSGQEQTATSGCIFEYLRTDAAVFYRYTITPGVDYPTGGITLEKQILGGTSPLIVSFTGSRINTLGLNIAQEGLVKADWSFVSIQSAKLGATDSSGTTTLPGDANMGWEAFLQTGAFGGAVSQTNRPIRDGSLNITNNVEENIYVWGSRFRREVPANRREVSGQITTYFEDTTEYDQFKTEAVIAATLSFNRQGVYFGIIMPEAKLTGSGTPQLGGSGVVTSQFSFDPYNQNGAGDISSVVLYSVTNALDIAI